MRTRAELEHDFKREVLSQTDIWTMGVVLERFIAEKLDEVQDSQEYKLLDAAALFVAGFGLQSYPEGKAITMAKLLIATLFEGVLEEIRMRDLENQNEIDRQREESWYDSAWEDDSGLLDDFLQ